MARKKKHEEHENLERWLVSYADFITLLFATFVVLYALSQVDIDEFKKLEESLRMAFSSQSLLEGQESIFSSNAQSILDSSATGQDPNPLMLEYLSAKYEESAFQDIKAEVDKKKLEGVEAKIDARGLVFQITDKHINFESGSAQLTPMGRKTLNEIGAMIFSKFQIHLIKVEGHTDSLLPAPSSIYPSNWELSSARASSVVRYLISTFNVSPKLFVATGYSDTVPVKASNKDQLKNRRVEIIVSKSKHNSLQNNDLKALLDKNSKTHYIKYNSPKKDAKNVIQNKELVAPVNTDPSAKATTIKNIYENENARINAADSAQTVETPSFIKVQVVE